MAAALDSLSDSARRFYPYIQRGVREGLSIEKIGRLGREAGASLSNATLRELTRRERRINEYGNSLDSLPGNRAVEGSFLPEAITAQRRRYSFTVEVIGTDPSNGRTRVQRVTISTERTLTPATLRQKAMDAVERGGASYGFDPESATIIRGTQIGLGGRL